MKLTVSHPYEIWGHQFLTEMIFMSCKETLKALLLAQFVTSFIEKYMNFLFLGHIFGHPQHLNAITFTLDAAMIKYAEICLWIFSFSYIMNFNEVDKFLCFRRKVTSQGLIKKVFWIEVDKINNHYNSDHDLEVMVNSAVGAESQCDAIFRLLFRLIWDI